MQPPLNHTHIRDILEGAGEELSHCKSFLFLRISQSDPELRCAVSFEKVHTLSTVHKIAILKESGCMFSNMKFFFSLLFLPRREMVLDTAKDYRSRAESGQLHLFIKMEISESQAKFKNNIESENMLTSPTEAETKI